MYILEFQPDSRLTIFDEILVCVKDIRAALIHIEEDREFVNLAAGAIDPPS